MSTPACPFCLIADGSTKPGNGGELAFRTEHNVIFEPLNPVTPGHLLVVPITHVADFLTRPWITAMAAFDAAQHADRTGMGDANLITSRGPAATQTVGHLHFHLVPRAEGDGLLLPWSPLPLPDVEH